MGPTSGDTFDIRRALPEEMPVVRQVLLECGDWLGRKGVLQWQDESEFTLEKLSARDADGETYLMWLAGKAVGTFRLAPASAGAWADSDVAAFYIRALGRTAGAPPHTGRTMLTWIEAEARRRNVCVLRLECDARNERINDYYLGNGFRKVGFCQTSEGEYSLMEKSV